MLEDLLTSPDFARYRRRQTLLATNLVVAELSRDEASPERLKGMLYMAKKLMRLPTDLISTADKDMVLTMEKETRKDINDFHEGIVVDSL